ncbi:MAG: T9SS type A sorting domain-containing protein [Bacteroidales bacterium]|nr:T9SS type A sorting domain-containing protein [Bacteroidales bacterium]
MKYFFIIAVFLILFPYQDFGQIIDKGTPTFNTKQEKEIPVIVLPEINIKKLQREDNKHTELKLKSLRFAQMIEVDISPEYKGIWESNPNGDRIWYLKIKSTGAYSLSILFDHYRLPIGSKLYVYSIDHKHVRGSFTYKNNKWNNILPIAPVKGDEIVLEYHEPKDVDFHGELHISSIAHDYKNVFNYLSKSTKGFGDSGDCNVNINCDDDDLWQLLKHSVCKITYNGWLCSGALINNTQHNGQPYFLTANHCINYPGDASAAVFYFNYESLDCENTDGRKDQTISGSTIIATPPEETIDFSLLELTVPPPPSYKPYYAGWNRDVVDPTSVTSIHHPSGDIKKITKSYDGATTGDYGEGYNEFAHWWIDEWDEGTTEGGSSGSPLFDQNGRLIGDLTGGDASCSYNYNDYYQQFYRSWQDFSEPDYRLKPWLDPINSGVISLNGYLPYDTIPSQLKASLVDTVIYLFWNEVIDTANIEFYYIYRNSVKLDSVGTANYTDTLASKNTLYKYFVTAKYKFPLEYESLPSNTVFVRTMDPLTLPFVETFEDQYFIPDYWYEERSNDTVGWEFQEGGFDGILDTAFEGSINAYFFNENSETSKLVLPRFNLSAYTNVKLSFYMHMQEFNNDVHNLRVLYKETDSLNWKSLRTYNTSIEEWEKKEISLPNLSPNYQIALEGVGLRGFGICIDSVSITEDGKFVDPDLIFNKNCICIYDSIEFSTTLDPSYDLYWDFGNNAIPTDTIGPGPHWVKYSSSGIKSVQLIVNDTYIKQDIEAVVVFDSLVIPSFTNIGNELISSSENGNQWYFNGSPVDGATNKTYIIEEDGDYFVEVTNSFNCKSVSESQYMIVNDIEEFVEDINKNSGIKIYPNPNKGSFILQIETVKTEDQYNYKIVDISGRIIQSGIINSFEKNKNIEILNPNEGIYFIQIYSPNYYFTSKILIKK